MLDCVEFDEILDTNAPDFAQKFADAIGVKPGDTVNFITPQFTRTDGIIPPLPDVNFSALPTLSEATLLSIGCMKWDEPDNNNEVLWLLPGEWYGHIPKGFPLRCISGQDEPFKHGETDDDIRFGVLAYGFMRKVSP
jgi:hypothetical protein